MKGYKKNSKYYQNAQKFFQNQIFFTQFGSNMFYQGHLRYTMDFVGYKNLNFDSSLCFSSLKLL